MHYTPTGAPQHGQEGDLSILELYIFENLKPITFENLKPFNYEIMKLFNFGNLRLFTFETLHFTTPLSYPDPLLTLLVCPCKRR